MTFPAYHSPIAGQKTSTLSPTHTETGPGPSLWLLRAVRDLGEAAKDLPEVARVLRGATERVRSLREDVDVAGGRALREGSAAAVARELREGSAARDL